MLILHIELNRFRGGCIVCMDYDHYATNLNFQPNVLWSEFLGISGVLTQTMQQFEIQSFNPSKFYLFGFSFGGQIVLQSGRDFGHEIIERIDGRYRTAEKYLGMLLLITLFPFI